MDEDSGAQGGEKGPEARALTPSRYAFLQDPVSREDPLGQGPLCREAQPGALWGRWEPQESKHMMSSCLILLIQQDLFRSSSNLYLQEPR